jgi:hypothetical protein
VQTTSTGGVSPSNTGSSNNPSSLAVAAKYFDCDPLARSLRSARAADHHPRPPILLTKR